MQAEPSLLTARQRARRDRRGANALVLVGIVLLVGGLAIVLFWSCLNYYFVTDDFALIEAGRAPLSVGIPAHFLPQPGGQYRPLVQYGYFWLVNNLFGLNPLAWHAANLLLHIGTVAVAAFVFRQVLRGWTGVASACIFFGLHSSAFLAIAWVAVVGDIWPTFFSLLALAFYLRYLDRRRWWALGAAVVACVAALLSKEMAITLPPLLVLGQVLLRPSARRLYGHRLWLDWSVAPFIGLWIAYVALVTRVQGVPTSGPYHPEINVGAVWTFLTYLGWGINLPQRGSEFPSHTVLAGIGVVFILAVLLAAVRRERSILFGLAWFSAGLIPVIFLPHHMFHYYLYWPLGGLALVVGRLVDYLTRQPWPAALRWGGALLLLVAIVLGDHQGIQRQHSTDATMVQAEQGKHVLEVIQRQHPVFPAGATIYFIEPAYHVFYLMGYGAALRLHHPSANLHVYFADHLPPPEHPPQPIYTYQWTGETVVAVPAD